MINMMNKLKYLKKKIRVWNGMRQSPKTRKHVLKQELADLEMIIDKGDASSDTLHKRAEVVKSIQEEVDTLKLKERSGTRSVDGFDDLTWKVVFLVSRLIWWFWTLDGSGEFSVASARQVIDDT
ncbi:hypothetical protein Tco_0836628, partial [Tanacetum coccineum]